MSINPIGLAYCVDNEDTAHGIQSLLGNYVQFRTFVAGGDNGNLPLAEQIRQFGGPCILLVSDNFLRSAACMYGGLSLVQDMQYRLLPIVVDGKKDGRVIPTSFERVTDIIQYINYWQDQYLDLRRQRHELSGLDEDNFNEHLRLVREISSEAGEFLRLLRSLDHYSFAQFTAQDYYAFFNFIGDEPAWMAFKSRAMAGITTEVVADNGEEEVGVDWGVNIPADDEEEVDVVDSEDEGEEVDITSMPDAKEAGDEGYQPGEEEEAQPGPESEPHAPQIELPDDEEGNDTDSQEPEYEHDISTMLEKAWGLASKGDLEAGLNLLEMLLEEYPQDSEIRYHLAMMLADKNEIAAAVRELRKILDAGEMHEDALSLLVDLYMETGDYDNARHTLTQLLQFNTQHEAGWLSLGELILKQDPEEVESARYAFERVLRLNPRNERALWFHASVCAKADSHLDEAKRSLNQLLSIVPDHREALSLLQRLQEKTAATAPTTMPFEPTAIDTRIAGPDGGDEPRPGGLTEVSPVPAPITTPVEPTAIDTITAEPDGGDETRPDGLAEVPPAPAPITTPVEPTAIDTITAEPDGGDEIRPGGLAEGQEDPASVEGEGEDTTNPQPADASDTKDPGAVETVVETEPISAIGELPEDREGGITANQMTTDVDTNTPQQPSSMAEYNPLQALKENIAQLEALLQAHEEAEKRAKDALAALQAAVPAKPGMGKTVLISGATSGIGKASARRFAEEGYRLILTGRRADRLQSLGDELTQQTGAELLLLNFDIRDSGAVQAAVDGLPDNWREIDILINNAGKAKGLDFIFQGQEDHWEEMIDTNVKGLLYLTRAISPGMVARRSGHIINVGSTAGKEVYPKGSVYCATKFAVDALTKGMRMDLYDKGIRVSQVSPAHVEETEFALVRFDGDEERARQVYDNFQPLKASDVAAVIFFMASQPSHVNVLDVVVQSSQQASSTMIDRSGRAG